MADEQTTEVQSSAWDQLVNRSKQEREAQQDFDAVVKMRADVEAAELAAPRPVVDWRAETAKAAWGATVDLTTESLILAKDVARTFAPLDKLLAGAAYKAQGQSFWEGVNEADLDNARASDDARRAADELAPDNDTMLGNFSRNMVQFMVPYAGMAKVATAGRGMGALTLSEATALGFIVDSGLFDPNQGNLSSLIKELAPEQQNVVIDFLATDPDDTEALNRLRNGLEGGVIGTALEGIFRTARWAINARKVKADIEAADTMTVDIEDLKVDPEPELTVTETVDEDLLKVDIQEDIVDVVLPRAEPRDKLFQEDGIHLADDQAGRVELRSRGDNLQITRAIVEPEQRGTGQGTRLYDEAARVADEQGKRLVSDTVVTEDAARVWESMKRRGHEIIDNRENSELVDGRWESGNGRPVFERVRGPEVEAPAPRDPDPAVRETTNLDLTLRSQLDMSPEQVAAYKKALLSDDPVEMDAVLKDFNDDTIDWANMDSPEAIKDILRVTSEVFADHIDHTKGGVQSHATTTRFANLVGTTGEEVHKLFKDLRDGVGITARMHAAERTMLSSARHLYNLRNKIKAAPGDVALKSEFYRHMQLHAALQAEVKGAKTEIARALNGMAILKADADEGFREFNDVIRHMGGSKTDSVGFEKFMDDILDARDLGELNARIRMTTGQRFKNAIIEFVINSMLSSLKTHAINFTSNTLNTFLYSADRFIGGSYRFLRGDPRLLREARIDLYTKFASLDEAWKLAKQAWVDGAPVTDKRQRLEFQTRKAIGMDGDSWLATAVNRLGTVVRLPGRALITGDEFFKAINRNAEVQALSFRKADEEAAAKGLTYGTPEYERWVTTRMNQLADPNTTSNTARTIRSQAIEKSRRVTFQEAPRTQGGARVEAAVNSNAFVKLVIAPFFRTPMNILRQGIIDRTPLGLTIKEARDQVFKGSPNERAEAIARMTTGVAAMAAGYSFISAGGPDKEFEVVGRRPYEDSGRVDGVLDYSIRVGDKWYQFNRLDPLGMWLGMMADMEYATRHFDETDPEAEGRVFAMAQGAMAGFYNNVANKTWMKSMADLLEMGEGFATNKPETVARAWAKFSSGQIGKFIPQIIKSTGTSLEGEKTAREAWTVLDGLTAQMPFMSKDLPPRHDVLGRPMTREMSMWSVINPFATSPESDDPVEREFAKLAFDVRPMQRSLAGGKVQLTAAEYSQLTGMVADFDLHGRLADLMTRDDWEDKSPERKVMEAKLVIEAVRRGARGKFLAQPEIQEKYKSAIIAEALLLQ